MGPRFFFGYKGKALKEMFLSKTTGRFGINMHKCSLGELITIILRRATQGPRTLLFLFLLFLKFFVGTYKTHISCGPGKNNIFFYVSLSHYRLKTPKKVFLQTVKTQMKWHRMWHFITVCTVCQDKIDIKRKENDILWKLLLLTPQYI